MHLLDNPIVYSLVTVFFVSFVFQKLFIYLAHRYQIISKSDQRRRHEKETPPIGGISVMIGWIAGLFVYSQFVPQWYAENTQSIITLGCSAIVLNILGLWDDIVNAGPYSKLFVQSLVAVSILHFEPNIHSLLKQWQEDIGVLSWIFGYVWIVGITNSINLIDGIDGLAGGMSFLSGLSLLVLLSWSGSHAENAAIQVALLLPAIASFLIFNWNPAKVFLGDNGSLPIGMILSSASLMGHAQSKSWVMLLSLVLIFGYPILDLTICVLKRYQNRKPFFKGDRIHLHFRISKLGLSVKQTTSLLLMIGLYMQISAITVNLLSPPAALLGLTIVFFSIFTLLFLVRSIEGWKVNKVFSYIEKHRNQKVENENISHWTITIDLAPILEKSTSHHKTKKAVQSLEALVRTLIRDSDNVVLSDAKIIVVFKDSNMNDQIIDIIKKRFQEKIDSFITLFNIECSTSSLTITAKKQFFLHQMKSIEKMTS